MFKYKLEKIWIQFSVSSLHQQFPTLIIIKVERLLAVTTFWRKKEISYDKKLSNLYSIKNSVVQNFNFNF